MMGMVINQFLKSAGITDPEILRTVDGMVNDGWRNPKLERLADGSMLLGLENQKKVLTIQVRISEKVDSTPALQLISASH